ncbi:transmembrane protein 45B-like [Punica granatum]|uniref:Transmembrane protein 45B-like n=2 Tax=Punica granatum TaxID=22663 RepID=A0A6P8E5X0_PUNGR|nr:transmembrane protein 45B-like [Punica granatum]PKI73621.1 hypothetical protein CRG98_005995 [Punica granatum]
MGTLVGHVAPGFGFFLLGLWHLYNHIKLHVLHPDAYASLPWFPASRLKYLELFLITVASSMSICMELFIGPRSHQPFDVDGTIPSNHLHNFEHATISLTFLTYAAFAVALDRIRPSAHYGLTQLMASIAFGQQLLLFHLHSADHMGVEGQYHLLLQLVIFTSLATTLLGIPFRDSFLVSFVRSSSILFQGLWLIVMGFMLWTPQFMPRGCFENLEEGHQVVRCGTDEDLHRAKSLVNIEFSWFLILVTVFSVSLYLIMMRFYGKNSEYMSLTKEDLVLEEDSDDVESHKKGELRDLNGFSRVRKQFAAIDTGR